MSWFLLMNIQELKYLHEEIENLINNGVYDKFNDIIGDYKGL